MKRRTGLQNLARLIGQSFHTHRSTSFDHDFGDKATLYDFNTSLSKRTTKCLFDVETRRVAPGVQHPPHLMGAFKAEREVAPLSIEGNVKTEQILDSSRCLARENLDRGFIAQPGSRCDRVLVVKTGAVCG
jgi:hypothetical protein